MTNQPLLDFILTEIKQGATKESITKDLLGAGWESADIQEGFKTAGIANDTPVVTPTVAVAQPSVATPVTPTTPSYNIDNTVNNTVVTPTTTTTPAEPIKFSTLDSYANPSPGNNPYSSPVYAGQVVQQPTYTTGNNGTKKALLFIIIVLLVLTGGGIYAVKANIIKISSINEFFKKPNISNVFTKVSSLVDKNNTKAEITDSTTPTQKQEVAVVQTPVVEKLVEYVLPTSDIQPLCTDVACKTYFEVWKKEQMYQNNIPTTYINGHFIPVSMQINKSTQGLYFNIMYDINIDWAKTRMSDSFMVKINAGDKTYPALSVRRGIYFSEAEVRAVIDALAYNTSFTWFTPTDHLFYNTRQSAVDAMQKAYPNNKLEISEEIVFDKTNIMEKTPEVLAREKQINDLLKSQNMQVVGSNKGANLPNPKAKREMFLVGYDSAECKTKNSMFIVKANLFTGDITTEVGSCMVY